MEDKQNNRFGRFVIKYRSVFVNLSVALVVLAVVISFVRGFNFGVDFTGGTVMEISYDSGVGEEGEVAAPQDFVKSALEGAGIESFTVQEFSEGSFIIKSGEIDEGNRSEVLNSLKFEGNSPEILRFSTIGPSIGDETKRKTLMSMIVIMLAVVLFVAHSFRKVSGPVASWKYGLAAVAALVHDVAIPIGFYSLLGYEVNSLFVVGLLSIVGLSVNDTIVVFDRIRENLKGAKGSFEEVVAEGLSQTLARSLNTSLTLVLALLALYLFGPAITKGLVFTMLIGTIFGTYSSIFFASPLLVYFAGKEAKKES